MFIPGFNNRYTLSINSTIVDTETGKVIPIKYPKAGYPYAPLVDNKGKRKLCYVHRALAQLYIPNPDNLRWVIFKDDNVNNLAIDNLSWIGPTELAIKKHGKPRRSNLVNEDLLDTIELVLPVYTGEVSVSTISIDLNINYSAIRYGLLELEKRGRIRRIVTQGTDKYGARYRYEVTQPKNIF